MVRDALTMGPREREDTITPHTRPPADDDADHMLVRTVECIDGHGRGRARLRAGVRLRPRRRRSGRSSTTTGTRPTPPAPARRSASGPTSRSASRATASRARHVLRAGERAYCALSWAEELDAPDGRRRRRGADRRDDALLARLARPGAHPRPSLPRPDPALGAGDQGPDVHADRRDGRGAHDLAAGDAGRRAQLGLPLHVDARHDVHAAGAALAQPGLGGRRVHAVRRRRRADRGRLAADHVRDRRPARPDRVDPRRSLRIRRARARCGSATAPSTSARTTSSARCSTRSCCTRGAASGCRAGCGRSSSRRPSARRRSGASPTRASGRRAASRSTTSRRS